MAIDITATTEIDKDAETVAPRAAPAYSYLSATTGSMRVARSAGR
jgi:hypothetical protein